MKKNMVYLVDGVEEMATIAEVSEFLGVKVTKKQVLAGEIEGVEYVESKLDAIAVDSEEDTDIDKDLVEGIEEALEEDIDIQETEEEDTTEEVIDEVVEEEPTEEVIEEDTEEEATTEEVIEEEVKVQEEVEPTTDHKFTKEELASMSLQDKLKLVTKPSQAKSTKKVDKYDADTEIDFPEVGHFADKDALKDYYKRLQDSHLDQWIELEGLTWKESGNAGIDRMRRCMAITNMHFPSQSKSKKSKSKYADYTTEQLLEMCLENGVEIADGKGNPKILRMYCIMALRKAGIIE